MKYLKLFTFLLFIVTVNSQTEWVTSYKLAEEFYNDEKNEIALKHAEIALELAKKNFGVQSLEYGNSQQMIGMIQYSLKRYDQAIMSFKNSIESFNNKSGEEINLGISYYLLGSLYVGIREFDKAKESLLFAGEIFESNEHSEESYYGLVLDELAGIYIAEGEWEIAAEILDASIDLQKKVNGGIDLAAAYNQMALVNYELRRFNRSEEYAYQCIEICEKEHLQNSVQYYKALGILGVNFVDHGNAYLGESLLLDSKGYYQDHKLEVDPFYYKLIIGLGRSNFVQEFYGESYRYFIYGKELYSKSNWFIQDYTINLEFLFRTLLQTGNFEEAEIILAEFKKTNQITAIIHEKSMLNLEGVLAYKKGDLRRAESIFSKIGINDFLDSKSITEESVEYVNNYATVLCDLGRFNEAESYYLSIIGVLENQRVQKIEIYLSALNNLALLYLDRGEFSKAEVLLTECVKKSNMIYGINSNEYALALNNIGAMYFEIGNYEVAVDYFINSSQLYMTNFGKESIEYTSLENNIAMLYSTVGDHEEALNRLLGVLELERAILGDKNLNHARNLLSIASEYIEMGQFEKAASFSHQSIGLINNLVGINHVDYADGQSLIGQIYFKTGELDKAKVSYNQAADIYKSLFGESNIDYARMLIQVASINVLQSDFESGIELFDKAQLILNSNMEDVFVFLSEQEKEKYLKTFNNDFNSYFKYNVEMSERIPELGGKIFEQSVKLKGLLLKSTSIMRNTIMNGSDDELKDMYNTWLSLKKRIADIYAAQGTAQSKKLEDLEMEANKLEKELYLRTNLTNNLNVENVLPNWKQIKSKIKAEDVVLDFVSYEDEIKGEVIYVVIIIDKQSDFPKVVKLFNESEIKEILGDYGANNFEYITKIYGDNSSHNTKLYDKIWKPIEGEISGKKSIFISPTGILHRISLWALGKQPDQLMIDLFNIQNLSTSLNLLKPVEVYKNDLDNVALYGDIYYNSPQTKEEHWNYLAGTATEIEGVEESFRSNRINVEVVRGMGASETVFKENSPNSSLIHVATHGFFFPDPEKLIASIVEDEQELDEVGFRGTSKVVGLSSFTHNKNPLMRSGLIFAGVNDLWNDDKYAKKDDGVLTAFEVTQMNFSRTKLVVLSACETGLGEIEGNEGVYGLQRAFKMQNIPYLINALWQVPDKETQEFMNYFYNELLTKSLEVKEAFYNARKAMRQKYPPYYWAAFVLIQ